MLNRFKSIDTKSQNTSNSVFFPKIQKLIGIHQRVAVQPESSSLPIIQEKFKMETSNTCDISISMFDIMSGFKNKIQSHRGRSEASIRSVIYINVKNL